MSRSISLSGVVEMLLGMSSSNKKWVADRLYESIEKEKKGKEHEVECSMLYSSFKQVKEIKEGKLQTRNVEDLLNEC